MECKANKVTRRGFVAAATSGLALSGLAAGAALAEEASKAEAPADASAAGDTYDAIVVGSGLAGLCTGVRLLEDGVKNVLLVTKEDTMATAGNSRIAGGQFLFPMEDTDEGEVLRERVHDLKQLVAAYQLGWITETRCEDHIW